MIFAMITPLYVERVFIMRLWEFVIHIKILILDPPFQYTDPFNDLRPSGWQVDCPYELCA